MTVLHLKKNFLIVFSLVAVLLLVLLCSNFIALPVAGIEADEVELPILMYHSILKNSKLEGKYVVTPDLLEQDLIYLRDHGYTTVFLSELVDYVEKQTVLPPKPVVITLDDGYYNNLTYLLPLLEKYQMKATISVVGEYVDLYSKVKDENPNYAHLSLANLQTMLDSGRVEIGNHTYSFHQQKARVGALRKNNESLEQYQEILYNDINKVQLLLADNLQIKPLVFTYPYGYISEGSRNVLEQLGFKVSLSCYEKINHLTRDQECLWELGRFNRPAFVSTGNFMKKIEDSLQKEASIVW